MFVSTSLQQQIQAISHEHYGQKRERRQGKGHYEILIISKYMKGKK